MSHIDPAVLTQLIVAISALLTAIAGAIKSWMNGRKLDENTHITKQIATNTATPTDPTSTQEPPK